MPKSQTPSEVLQKFIDNHQTNPFALSKALNVAYQSVTHILQGKSRISAQMAIRLSKHYGNKAEYWLDIQSKYEIDELSADKKFIKILSNIPKAQKPTGKQKRKHTTINPAVPKKAAMSKAAKR